MKRYCLRVDRRFRMISGPIKMPQTRKEILEGLGRNPASPFARPTNAPGYEAPNEPTGQAPTGGMVVPGTIKDLYLRKVLHNPDGSYSTTSSESNAIEDPGHPYFGKEMLYPTVINGVRFTSRQAFDHAIKTGQHLGIFDTPGHAEDYATWLHREQARRGGTDWHHEIALPQLQPWTSWHSK